jgi:hypothetical protein
MEAVEHHLSTDDLHPIDLVESLAENREWPADSILADNG